MLVKQISVFLENKSGHLSEATRTLSKNKIDIRALYIAETTDYGILRMIVDKPDEAQAALAENGFTVSETDVIAIAIPDHPGMLDEALETLSSGDISIEYLYAFVGRSSSDAIVVIRVEDTVRALALLEKSSVRVMNSQEVYKS